MSKSWNRVETWVALVVLAVGGLLAALAGLHVYTTATAIRWHPEANRVPSVSQESTSAGWSTAVGRAREAVRTAVSEQNLPGVSVAVGVEGDLVWAEGFGWADVESRVGVTPAMRFRIGTASVPLTSAAVGLLLEEGSLKLDAPIQTYVPRYPPKPSRVTLGHVMGHLGGLHTDGGDEGPLFGMHCGRPSDAVSEFGGRELLFEPGTRHQFSSYGWILVSAAIETAARETFGRFMRTRIFEPLGMQSTVPDSAIGTVADRSRDYFPRYASTPRYGLHPMREIDLSCYAGAGVFLSTPSDLVRFGMGITGGTLLRAETVQLLQAPQRLRSGELTGYGLGWKVETLTLGGRPTVVVGHDGDVLGGPVASLRIVRDRRLVVAVTSNISYSDTAAIAVHVAEAFTAEGLGTTRR